MKHAFFLLIAFASAAHARMATFGVKVGLPVTSAVPYTNLQEATGRRRVGLTVEFHLFSGLSAEADALFRGYSFVQSDAASPGGSYRLDAKAWDFPFLPKYRFLGGPARPFVDVGHSLTHKPAGRASR